VRIKTPELELTGATLPGLPNVVLGRNQHVAWGFTNTNPDSQDLYIERFNASGVDGPAGSEAVEVVNELIELKGQPSLNLPVRITKRGPIISDVNEAAKLALGGAAKGYALSFRWTALDADNTTIRAGLKMNAAKNAAEFEAALRDYQAPMQNMVYADTAGQFGRISAGRVPIRGADHDLRGHAPAPAWEAKYAWQGFLKFDDLPMEKNPARGYIATANANITLPGYAPFISAEWAAPYRTDRILQMLDAKPKHDLASMQAMHADITSLAAPRFIKAAGELAPATEAGKQAWQLLKTFGGVMDANKAEPLIYNAWVQQAAKRVFSDEISRDYSATAWQLIYARRDLFNALLNTIETKAPWCDDTLSTPKETCENILSTALDEAMAELVKKHGADMSKWRWGNAHYARSEHRPFGKNATLAKLFDLRVPTGGDTYTVNVGRTAQRDGEPFVNIHAASLRGIYDLANTKGGFSALIMHSTGQSGNVLSPQYRDLSARWARVEYLDMGTTEAPAAVLTLQPGK
jgi:penicillin G amidase